MSIQFFKEDVNFPTLDFFLIIRVLKQTLRANKYKLGDINYIFCSDDYLLQLNKQFLDHDYYTDVITFDYTEKGLVGGDIYISIDRVRNNSETYHQLYETELLRVISHGFLHLLGYNDKDVSEIQVMRLKESELIQKMGSFF
ncbi:MAG TPA: rRNA maturation RNase YbeY [Prolixibacteraceae bacterium]